MRSPSDKGLFYIYMLMYDSMCADIYQIKIDLKKGFILVNRNTLGS